MLKDASLAGIDVLKAKDADEIEVPFLIEDGNTPLPSEIEATETVVLPEIQVCDVTLADAAGERRTLPYPDKELTRLGIDEGSTVVLTADGTLKKA